MTRFAWPVVLLAVVGLSAQQRAVPPPLGTASLAGHVRDGRGTPIPGARVFIDNGGSSFHQTATDADGRFALSRLPAGSYNLSASKEGFLPGSYGATAAGGLGTRIDLRDDQQVTTADLRLWSCPSLSGQVLNDKGEPMAGQSLHLIKIEFIGGRLHYSRDVTSSRSSGVTNERGAFEFPAVDVGTYVVAVAATGASAGVRDPHAMVFYPSVLRPELSERITLEPEQRRDNVNIIVPRAKVFTVEGTLTGLPDGLQVQGAHLYLAGSSDGVPADFEVGKTTIGPSPSFGVGPNGQFRFESLTEGQYVMRASASPPGPADMFMATSSTGFIRARPGALPPRPPDAKPAHWAESYITVSDAAIAGLVVPWQAGVNIKGRLVLDGTSSPPAWDAVRLGTVADRLNVMTPTGVVDPNGSFTSGGVPPGRYQLYVMGLAAPWRVQSIAKDGRDLSGSTIDVGERGTSDVVITLTDQSASLEGTIRTPRAEIKAGAPVLLFPVDRQQWIDFGVRPLRLLETQALASGRYSFSGVLPGEYYVAVPDWDPRQRVWQEPATMAALANAAVKVTIVAHQKNVQDIKTAR